jgi:hypothetical protein
MPAKSLYPTTVEVRRLIDAVQKTGIQIGKIEIEPARVRIYAFSQPADEPMSAYERYKASLAVPD